MSLIIWFLLFILAIYINRKIKINQTKKIFIFFFFLTGGVQSIFVLLDDSLIISNAVGFTNTLSINTKFPQIVDKDIIIFTLLIWAIYYLILYFSFILLTSNSSISNLLYKLVNKIPNFNFLNSALVLSFFWFIIKFSNFAFEGYIAPPLKISVVSMLLLSYVVYTKGIEVTLFKSKFLLCFIFLILPEIIDFSRGRALMPFIVFALFFHFNRDSFYKKSSIKFYTFIFILIFFTTSFKYFNGAVELSDENFLNFVAITILNDNEFLFSFFVSFLERLNSMQSLYWYFFDHQNTYQVFIGDRFESIMYIFNTFIPGVIADSNLSRNIYGYPLETWLFLSYTGGNSNGGFFLPPIVEYIWATDSTVFGILIILLLYIFISLFLRIFLKYTLFAAPCIMSVIFTVFLKNESISILLLYSFKYLPVSILICTFTYRILKRFSFFILIDK